MFELWSKGGDAFRRVLPAVMAISIHRNQEKSAFFWAISLQSERLADLGVMYDRLHVTIVDKDGESHTFEVAAGDNLLDIAQANDLEMEGLC